MSNLLRELRQSNGGVDLNHVRPSAGTLQTSPASPVTVGATYAGLSIAGLWILRRMPDGSGDRLQIR